MDMSDNSDRSKQLVNHNDVKKLLVAIEQSADTVMITNEKAEIEFINPYFTQLTGYSIDEVIGMNPRFQQSGFHSPEFYKELWDTISKGEKWVGEFYNKKKNGEYYWESATITPVTDDNGQITNFIAIKEDITQRKLQQEALEQSEKKLKEMNATKDKFFSIIAHDLTNPINALLGFSKLAVEAVNNYDFERSLRYNTMIDQLSNQISGLFQDLMLWSRAQTGTIQFKPILTNVRHQVSESVNLLIPVADKKGIDIDVQVDEELVFSFDRHMVGTVIRNLVQNAIKFSYPGSRILIRAEETERELLVTVTDSGIGIPDGAVNTLFTVGNTHSSKGTANETGTGLGLPICREFVNIHKGKIWAESEVGKGSRFFFSLPENN
jgi:PAS domain S-box-containing protein